MLTSKANIVPRIWGGSCLTWELLSRAELVVFHEFMPPGTCEEEHAHRKARQFFFVLDGELSINVFGLAHVLHRHEGLDIPPGEFHWVRNASDAPVEFIAIAHPTTRGDKDVRRA
jgi:mannose-6-phosphate isomerase-like protein (cupin superfamily)